MSKEPHFTLTLRGAKRPFSSVQVMGILNATPDSFYAESRKQSEQEIASRANEIIEQGGSIIDVGACSTRPGSVPVSAEEEMRRLRKALPIVKHEQPDATISVDTFRADVARMCVEEFGVDIINDVRPPQNSDEYAQGMMPMFGMVARLRIPYVLMSVKADIESIKGTFQKEIRQLHELGVEDIIIDPGYGFGKTCEENYCVLEKQRELLGLGRPILVGVSRKRMIRERYGESPDRVLEGTSITHRTAIANGACILRVHDVREAVEVAKFSNLCWNLE